MEEFRMGNPEEEKLKSGEAEVVSGRGEGKSVEGPELREIVNREKESLKAFFGKEIEVPSLPAEITAEKYRELKEKGFALHYLPAEELPQDRELPGWRNKPDVWFLDSVKRDFLPKDVLKLPGLWVAIDERGVPTYENGQKTYERDVLAPVLEQLRNEGLIADYKNKGSRFNASYNELHKPEVKDALAKVLGVRSEQLRLPRVIEQSYLGNAFYSRWLGATTVGGLWDLNSTSAVGDQASLEDSFSNQTTMESFEDLYLENRGHVIGTPDLTDMFWEVDNNRNENRGFRLVIVFSKP